MNRKNRLYWILTILLVINLALLTYNLIRPKADGNVCLPPPFTLAYQPNITGDPFSEGPPARVSPVWDPQLPEDKEELQSIFSIVADGKDMIWFVTSEYRLFRFNPESSELIEYTLKNQEGVEKISFLRVFTTKDMVLWGMGYFRLEALGDEMFLARYNEATDQFEIITDSDGIFIHDFRTGIVEDSIGNFWVVSQDGLLIRFEPATRKAEIVLGKEEQGYYITPFSSLAISPDGTLWLEAYPYNPEGTYQKIFAIEYDPLTGSIKEHNEHFGPITPILGSGGLLFDHMGRLWISEGGFIQFAEDGSLNWYEVIPSPVFITNRGSDLYPNSYKRGFPELESMERYIWFRSNAGVIRLDLETDEWCLLTTFYSPITEDSNHNIWIVGEGQIYKYKQTP